MKRAALKPSSKILPRRELARRTPMPAATTPLPRKAPAKVPATKPAVAPVDLRADAQGKPCLVRLPGCCGLVVETVVLAHLRQKGTCGGGQKPPDTLAARACVNCHAIIDGRVPMPKISLRGETLESLQRRLAHYEGVGRTLHALHQAGYRMVRT